MRGDSVYCPLSLSLDSYGNCLVDCHHCWVRNLNHVWGSELKPADLEILEMKLYNGPKNKKPTTPLAYALSQKKTIRFGNKTDPFQPVERQHRVSREVLKLLCKYEWTFVIQTRCTDVMMEYERHLLRAHKRGLLTVMPVMSPGLDKDWEILERKGTTPPAERIKHAVALMKHGVSLGFNGEPFIPGYHTVQDFEDTLKLLKSNGILRYNTYNFHFNAYVAKRMHGVGIDIEKIWYHNQDNQWKIILRQLIDLSTKYGILLGCPDFVNTGRDRVEPANTCCGIDVPNPCTFNAHHFKKHLQNGHSHKMAARLCYDGTAARNVGLSVMDGTSKNMYTMRDAGWRMSSGDLKDLNLED